MIHANVEDIAPGRGLLLVEITERPGGTTSKGLVVPETADDHPGKDTAYGVVVRLGSPPRLRHKRTDKYHNCVPAREEWPEEYAGVGIGDIVLFPRDVPLVVDSSSTGRRYGLVYLHECIAVVEEADPGKNLREQGLEVARSF